VVDALASLGEELPDRSLGPRRGKELDVGGSHLEQDLVHALVLDRLAVDRLDPERASVVLDRGLEVENRDPHMVDVRQHPATIPGTSPYGPAER
jgi:hypothetical protein